MSINIYIPDTKVLSSAISYYERYNKEDLMKFAEKYFNILSNDDVTFVNMSGETVNPPASLYNGPMLMKFYQIKKGGLAELLAIFNTVRENIMIAYGYIPEAQRETFEKIARQVWMGALRVNQLADRTVVKKTESWYSSNVVCTGYFNSCDYYIDPKGYIYKDAENIAYISAPELYADIINDIVWPLAKRPLKIIDNLPDNKPLATYSAEDFIGSTIDVMQALANTRQVSLGKSKLLTASAIKNLDKAIAFHEPAGWETNPKLENWCKHSFELLFASCYQNRAALLKTSTPKATILKEMLTMMRTTLLASPQLFTTLLPRITGITQSMITASHAQKLIDLINGFLKLNLRDTWIDVEQLKQKIVAMNPKEACAMRLSSPSRYSAITELRIGGTLITPAHVYNACGRPFVDGYLMLLAAAGYVTVAWDETEVTAYSEGLPVIHYVRLTEAGLYAFDIIKTYEVKNAARLQSFEVDPNRLIVRILDGPAIFTPWIESIADSIGGNRYVVSAAKVLAKCDSIKNIDDIEKFFRKNICSDPGPAWDNFFTQMRRKARAVTQSTNEYMLFELDPKDSDLHKLVMSHESLRGHIRRAEGYMVLVERTYFPLFKQVLKSNGYFL